ncbi:unnamed protein product, partial [Laminaria digitata]
PSSATDQRIAELVLLRREYPDLPAEQLIVISQVRKERGASAASGDVAAANDHLLPVDHELFALLEHFPDFPPGQLINALYWNRRERPSAVAGEHPPAPLVPDGGDGGHRLG